MKQKHVQKSRSMCKRNVPSLQLLSINSMHYLVITETASAQLKIRCLQVVFILLQHSSACRYLQTDILDSVTENFWGSF